MHTASTAHYGEGYYNAANVGRFETAMPRLRVVRSNTARQWPRRCLINRPCMIYLHAEPRTREGSARAEEARSIKSEPKAERQSPADKPITAIPTRSSSKPNRNGAAD